MRQLVEQSKSNALKRLHDDGFTLPNDPESSENLPPTSTPRQIPRTPPRAPPSANRKQRQSDSRSKLEDEMSRVQAEVADLERRLHDTRKENIRIASELYGTSIQEGERYIESVEKKLDAAAEQENSPIGLSHERSIEVLSDDISRVERRMREIKERNEVELDRNMQSPAVHAMQTRQQRPPSLPLAQSMNRESSRNMQQSAAIPPAQEREYEYRYEYDEEDETEIERMRMGMIELKVETERYAMATRRLQEKHEQMVRTIIDKYMPGL